MHGVHWTIILLTLAKGSVLISMNYRWISSMLCSTIFKIPLPLFQEYFHIPNSAIGDVLLQKSLDYEDLRKMSFQVMAQVSYPYEIRNKFSLVWKILIGCIEIINRVNQDGKFADCGGYNYSNKFFSHEVVYQRWLLQSTLILCT